ncbi:hypothetical protein NHF50_00175 [Flavobacterium sp. NRK F10]|uniref:hypothetical protein n=1 Tax=Flavobacterium sp. NRK F10 TaxID=2954931 RepID=UPI002090D915|nr:hypothetical protein [Flavobacterium sp. NRK F10]MCO6173451.1 hypothetical protein [Flavobacterium sp. NRK F10]
MKKIKTNFILSIFCLLVTNSLFAQVPQSEKDALIAFYNSTNGDNWTNTINQNGAWPVTDPLADVTSWNSSSQTGWYGVTVLNGHVFSVTLNNNSLNGNIPSGLSDLQNLQGLTLMNNNQLTGNIPVELGGLQNLQSLNLMNNQLSGIVPTQLGNLQNLLSLYLGQNQLTGTIPIELGNLQNLQTLNLVDNQLTGTIPTDLGNLQSLKILGLSHNQLTGTIPVELGDLNNLEQLLLADNQLTGTIPVELGNLLNLIKMDVELNQLTGNIPIEIENLHSLQYLFLTNNKLSGGIPVELKNLQNLVGFSAANNQLSGYIPLELNNLSNITSFVIRENKFTFNDIEDTFSFFNAINNYQYAPQAKVDAVRNDIVSEGTSYTMTMHEDGNYSANEQYQWYKGVYPNGVAIAGATARQYTINPVSSTDSGSYYCLSDHPTITKPGVLFKDLVLEREQINLTVTVSAASCTETNPNSVTVNELLVDLLTHLIQRKLAGDSDLDIEGSTPPELIALAPYVTDPDPVAIYNFSSIINTDGTVDAVQFSFSPTETYDILINSEEGNTLDSLNSNNFQFDLSNYNNANEELLDIGYSYNIFDIKVSSLKHIEFCPSQLVSCTATNPYTDYVVDLFLSLINDMTSILQGGGTIDSSYNSVYLQNLTPYITVSNPGIYNFNYDSNQGIFQFSFSNTTSSPNYDVWVWSTMGNNLDNLDTSTYINPDTFLDYVGAWSSSGNDVAKFYIRNINFCPDALTNCAITNPHSATINKLLVNLLSHLIQRKLAGDSDQDIEGSTPLELIALAPYVTDMDPVAIYNFVSTYNSYNQLTSISFSFSIDHLLDISIGGGNFYGINGNNFQFDLSNYSDPEQEIIIDAYAYDNFLIKNGIIKHIEFCPDELFCKHHIAIVVDESGSIDDREAFKIRKQINSFIEKQAADNDGLGANIYVSLIGLSDSDTFDRTDDDQLLNVKVTGQGANPNINLFNDWLLNYRGRDYTSPGISPSSDYWKSGLDVALATDAELVILITDGCETDNAAELKETVRMFNNNLGGTNNTNDPIPHLYVIGLNEGFYVDTDTNPYSKSSLAHNEDPNYNSELVASVSLTSRVASNLRTSLKYLMEYTGTDFPVNDKYKFIYRPVTAGGVYEMVDYYGAEDFRFFTDEINYLSNGLVDEVSPATCGDLIPLELCNNCINFKLDIGQKYIISAWVKEEQRIQVPTYSNAEIQISFRDENDYPISGSLTVCGTSGDIIDGWQRIFKEFTVPQGAAYIDIELVNKSQVTPLPIYFDDIRIHPKDGSMKSFVYDPETFRLMSELDENNYSTFYEYDNEGGLIRVKKETSRGVKTIQETRSGNFIFKEE